MRRVTLCLLACMFLLVPNSLLFARKQFRPLGIPTNSSKLTLDGQKMIVQWNDGDTFRIIAPTFRGKKARLRFYNTLENYGNVHRWGKWKAKELAKLNDKATKLAQSHVWNCHTMPGRGGYGRLLVSCFGLAKTLIAQGLAHVFSMRGPGHPVLVKLQADAIKHRRGIWKKGVPSHIVTSVHKAIITHLPGGRSMLRKIGYNRLISTKDGSSTVHRHQHVYNTCKWVCMKGSCLLYVPYRRRYGHRKAHCL